MQAIENLNPAVASNEAEVRAALAPEVRPGVVHSSRWVFAGTILSRPIQLFTAVFIARLLGPASYGVFGLATSMAVTLSLVAGLGLGDASYKYVAEFYRKDKQNGAEFAAVIIWTATIFAVALFLSLWATSTLWKNWIFPTNTSSSIIALSLCLAATNLISALLAGVFSGLQRFREFTIFSLVQAIAVAMFVVVFRFRGSEGALLAYVTGAVVCLVWGAVTLARIDRAFFTWPGLRALRKLKGILKFSAPIWVGAFALTPIMTFTFAFLSRQSNGEYQLGLFSTANGLRALILILPGVISVVITPALIEAGGAHGEQHAYQELLKKSLSSLVVLTIPLLILSLFLSDLLFIIFGKAYGNAFRLFMPLTASAAIAAIASPVLIVMLAKNRTWVSLGFGVIKSVLLVILSLLLVPRYLGWGLAWAFFLSETIGYVLALEFCHRTGAVPGSFRRIFYWSCLGVCGILALSLYLPTVVRWAAAAPLTLAAIFILLRGKRDIGGWMASLAPVSLRPGTARLMRLITS